MSQLGNRMIYGRVNSDGSVGAGVGFSSSHERKGRYVVRFAEAFAEPPVVVVTQVKDLRGDYKQWFDDNALVVDATAEDVVVAIRDVKKGAFEDDSFNFIAMGRTVGADA